MQPHHHHKGHIVEQISLDHLISKSDEVTKASVTLSKFTDKVEFDRFLQLKVLRSPLTVPCELKLAPKKYTDAAEQN